MNALTHEDDAGHGDAGLGLADLDDLTVARAHEDDYPWDEPWKGEFLRAFRMRPNVTRSAQAAGMTRQGVWWARKHDPLFAVVYEDAREQSTDVVESFGIAMASNGLDTVETRTTTKRALDEKTGKMVTIEESTVVTEGKLVSPQLTMFMLAAHRPSVYSRAARMEHTGKDGGPVEVQHLVYREPTSGRALELARIALEQEAEAERGAIEAGDLIDAEVVEVVDVEPVEDPPEDVPPAAPTSRV